MKQESRTLATRCVSPKQVFKIMDLGAMTCIRRGKATSVFQPTNRSDAVAPSLSNGVTSDLSWEGQLSESNRDFMRHLNHLLSLPGH